MVLAGVTIWESTYPSMSFDSFVWLMIAWAIVGVIWLGMIAVRIYRRSVGLSDSVAPAIAIAVLLLVASGLPFDTRFHLAEPSMTVDAERVMATPKLAQRVGSIGPWEVEEAEVFDGGMRFTIPDLGWLDSVGFAYSVDGPPPNMGEDAYTSLGDHWWIWEESW